MTTWRDNIPLPGLLYYPWMGKPMNALRRYTILRNAKHWNAK